MLRPGNLTLYQGDDWAGIVTVSNVDGTPADLTGYTAQSQIRTGPADQTWQVAAELTCAIVPVTSPLKPNQISISLTGAQTAALTDPAYQWDLQVTSPGGLIATLLAGQVSITSEVTREVATSTLVVEIQDPYNGLFI